MIDTHARTIIVDGRPFWEWPDGFRAPVISGGDGSGDGGSSGSGDGGSGGGSGGDGGAGGSGSGDGGTGGGDGGRTFTQAELDERVKARLAEADRKRERDVAEALGMSLAEAKKFVDAAKDAEDRNRSEAEKRDAALREREQKAEEREREADRKAHDADVRDALREAGVPKEKVRRAANALVTDLEVGASEEEISAAIDELRKDVPEFFGASKGDGKGGSGGAPDSDPQGTPPNRSGSGEDAFQRGAERAKGSSRTGYPILEKSGSS